jgi:hypothetical protein
LLVVRRFLPNVIKFNNLVQSAGGALSSIEIRRKKRGWVHFFSGFGLDLSLDTVECLAVDGDRSLRRMPMMMMSGASRDGSKHLELRNLKGTPLLDNGGAAKRMSEIAESRWSFHGVP